jgi:hypothetical protein
MPGILGASREQLDSSPTRWFVVWCNSQSRLRWWDYLARTPEGFRHVYALRWDGYNWLLFNPHAGYTDVAIVAAADENALAQLVDPDATVLEVEAFRAVDRLRGRWWAGPMTCVEQVKALLGLPVGVIFTPWQLYRYLSRCADASFNPRILVRPVPGLTPWAAGPASTTPRASPPTG